jgi:hypothetical protein
MMSTTSPSHLLTQTTTAIPEIILSGEWNFKTVLNFKICIS